MIIRTNATKQFRWDMDKNAGSENRINKISEGELINENDKMTTQRIGSKWKTNTWCGLLISFCLQMQGEPWWWWNNHDDDDEYKAKLFRTLANLPIRFQLTEKNAGTQRNRSVQALSHGIWPEVFDKKGTVLERSNNGIYQQTYFPQGLY